LADTGMSGSVGGGKRSGEGCSVGMAADSVAAVSTTGGGGVLERPHPNAKTSPNPATALMIAPVMIGIGC
jgi:hypothetical protein